MTMGKLTQISIDGYFSKDVCEKLKEKLSGQTYMNFQIGYSNCAGNCTLMISTNYPDTTEEELHDMFLHFVLNMLAMENSK